jgi:thiamine-phosphate pyrophosphorylase
MTTIVLSRPFLMLITDRHLAAGEDALVEAVRACMAAGVNAVQLREKDLPTAQLLPLAHRLREVTNGRALLLVNGDLDLALACEADGLHLPEAAPPVQRPRAGFLLGRSVHSVEAAVAAEAEGLDYLVAGPVYATTSHPDREPAGLRLIRKVAVDVAAPVLAVGGVTAVRAGEVLRAGGYGVAVISAVLADPSPGSAARNLREALDSAYARVNEVGIP